VLRQSASSGDDQSLSEVPLAYYCQIVHRHQHQFDRVICYIATTYQCTTSASLDDKRLANHATRPRLGRINLPEIEEEGADIYFILHPQQREGAVLPAQRLAGSGECYFILGLGRVDGEDTQGNGRQLRETASHTLSVQHKCVSGRVIPGRRSSRRRWRL
jgi:hypothetical protein